MRSNTAFILIFVFSCFVFSFKEANAKEKAKHITKQVRVDYEKVSYTIKQDSKSFTYKDKTSTKTYKLKDCNKPQFEIFWANYEINKDDISTLNKVKNITPLTYKENKEKSKKINPHSKLGKFLTNVPEKLFAFDVNEKMKCKK